MKPNTLKQTIHIALITFLIQACTSNHNKNPDNQWLGKTQTLYSQTLHPDIDTYISRDIQIHDTLLIIRNSGREPMYHIYQPTSDSAIRHITSFGRQGKGPQEYISP
jgi:hypothetical protein